MTPHDELMALAGKWIAEAEAEGAFDLLDRGHSNGLHACAADLRALLDSDAFRAMVRDAERYRWLRDDNCSERVLEIMLAVGPTNSEVDAAIDAAMERTK